MGEMNNLHASTSASVTPNPRSGSWQRGLRRLASLGIVTVLASGCAAAGLGASPSRQVSPTATVSPSATASPTAIPSPCATSTHGAVNLEDVPGDFASLGANTTYWFDIDGEESTSPCVLFTIPAEGWQSFLGTYKDRAQDGRVLERVTAGFPDVTNLTVDACTEQTARDPAV
jgi:hypothetical protein